MASDMAFTEDAVSVLTSVVSSYLDGSRRSIGLFLDLVRAFDTVTIQTLRRKIEGRVVRGMALEWFESYLSDRNQCPSVGQHMSDIRDIGFGVP